jgi:hypothetical protein
MDLGGLFQRRGSSASERRVETGTANGGDIGDRGTAADVEQLRFAEWVA